MPGKAPSAHLNVARGAASAALLTIPMASAAEKARVRFMSAVVAVRKRSTKARHAVSGWPDLRTQVAQDATPGYRCGGPLQQGGADDERNVSQHKDCAF